MNPQQYSAALALLIVPPLIGEIVKRGGLDELTAADKLYHSHFYTQLAKEELKLWHYSPVTLCDMFEEEQRTGKITYPEEAC